ncbi:hypothetical protein ACNQGB_16720 [Flavobacterium sp. XS1P32]|uniref:hypothetical protein n=1 Tax=unclassified Flavobacterium TaxID=196869 RepID=UPI003AAA2E57
MKKLFLPLILVLTIKGYGQTYTMELLFRKPQIACNEVFWTFSDYIVEDDITIGTKTYTDIPNFETFKLSSFFFCPATTITPACERVSVYNDEKTAIQLIKGSTLNITGCYANIRTTSFKPNVTVKNVAPNGSTTICSGEELQLAGFPVGFPDEAYHWQYSLDNQQTWIDVPTNFNNNPTTNFSVKDVLGDSHVNYFDKQLYFRLGYQNRPFTDPITITYSACAPVITNLNPIQPNCIGDPMTVIVTFDRPLDLEKDEKLTNFQIIKKNGQLTGNQISEIFAFDASNATQYTYNNVTGLINGEIYTVKYQAFQGVKERGVPETDKDFQYQDPTAVQFEIISAQNPLCHDGTVEIVISVKGGTGTYKFYDDTIEIIPTAIKGTDGFYYLKNLAPKDYKIKVVDGNGCIDENKHD